MYKIFFLSWPPHNFLPMAGPLYSDQLLRQLGDKHCVWSEDSFHDVMWTSYLDPFRVPSQFNFLSRSTPCSQLFPLSRNDYYVRLAPLVSAVYSSCFTNCVYVCFEYDGRFPFLSTSSTSANSRSTLLCSLYNNIFEYKILNILFVCCILHN